MIIKIIIKSTLSFPEVPALSFNESVLSEVFRDSVGFSWIISLIGMSTFFRLLRESATGDINWYLRQL